jgi:hypothetical protein
MYVFIDRIISSHRTSNSMDYGESQGISIFPHYKGTWQELKVTVTERKVCQINHM